MATRHIPDSDEPLACTAYIRVSQETQAQGHSPTLQREALIALARTSGYTLSPAHIFEDHERGSRVTRVGYQKLLSLVRAGEAQAVLVYMFDRFGRDGGEWITRARELERLGVPIISAQEGKEEPGIIRFVRAGMAEQYSRDLAKRVRPALERAARAGIKTGATPFGYRRLYAEHADYQQRRAAQLVPDEATAWVVRDLYQRYAAGGEGIRGLVRWLNSDEQCPPSPTGGAWNYSTVGAILRNPVYAGQVRHNKRPHGLYERAAPGTEFTVPGLHPALVEQETWATVQTRLDAAALSSHFNRATTPHGRPVSLLTGFLRCAQCGGPVTATAVVNPGRRPQYLCADRHAGRSTCTGRQFPIAVVDAAVLAELGRLEGKPWLPQTAKRLQQGQDGELPAARQEAVSRALERERERLRRLMRRLSDDDHDLTPEEVAAGREVRAEIAARVRALEAQLAAHAHQADRIPRLQALHAQVRHKNPAQALTALLAADLLSAARAFLATFLTRAVVAAHVPQRAPTWTSLAVEWTPDIAELLEANLLHLAQPLPPPVVPAALVQRWERRRRYRARLRATQNEAPPEESDTSQ